VRAIRALGRAERIGTVRADPEATPDTAFGAALLETPWRAAPKVQPPVTRVVDLTLGEEALRAGMRRKHRQYVNKAERSGLDVDRFEGASFPPSAVADALGDFNRIYRQTAQRAGFVARGREYYERVWAAFAPGNHVRLSFAVSGGERVAALFHFTCGDRVVESYGGMTDAGAELRANYLLKWAAIRDFAREGFAVYDMWGLATGGIRQFKEGFGGTEVAYVGARDLPLRAPVDTALRLALPAYGVLQRVRHRLLGAGRSAPAADEAARQPDG
jgi:lipid II:glycine glycyltransferase (peptidoglycan interpeptide bridge formation enzyme)